MGILQTLALTALVACHPAPRKAVTRVVSPREGIQIALYPGEPTVAWIEERRRVEITDKTLALPRGGDTGSMAQLTIEPLAGSTLRIGTCTSDPASGTRAGETAVRCSIDGPRGTHLIRVRYPMQAEIAMEHDIVFRMSGTATIVSRTRVTPPAWQDEFPEAQIVVFDRAPGTGVPPAELARAVVPLDGAETVIVTPGRTVPARSLRVIDAGEDVTTERLPVQMQLALPAGELVTGRSRVVFEDSKERRMGSEPAVDRTRVVLDLGADLQMYGRRISDYDGRNQERVRFEVANDSDDPRDVWITHRVGGARYRVTGGVKTVRADGDIRVLLAIPAKSRASVTVVVGQTP